MNRRFLFGLLGFAAVVYGAVLAGAFLVYALEVMDRLPLRFRGEFPIDEVGVAVAAVFVGLGALIASVRYLFRG